MDHALVRMNDALVQMDHALVRMNHALVRKNDTFGHFRKESIPINVLFESILNDIR